MAELRFVFITAMRRTQAGPRLVSLSVVAAFLVVVLAAPMAAEAQRAKPPGAVSSGSSAAPASGSTEADSSATLRKTRDSLYISILERTNDQLSLASNPWSLMVAGLGVLFTIGAIVAAWLLYTQSREFREERKRTLAEARDAILQVVGDVKARTDTFLAELRSQADTMHADLAKRIDDATARANETSGEAKKEVEKNLASLKDLQARVEAQQRALTASASAADPSSYVMQSAIPVWSTTTSLFNQRQKCVNCGKVFKLDRTYTSAVTLYGQEVMCPYCHTTQVQQTF